MVREDEDIILVLAPGQLDEAIRDLVRVGLDRIVGWYDAAKFAELVSAGAEMEQLAEVSIEEGRALVESGAVNLLDVRRTVEFAAGHIAGAQNIAHTRLDARLSEVPRDKPLLVNCQLGGRSARACALLQKHGYNVTNLAGGYAAWAKKQMACTT
jgi:hydroxyacylglutathione hydrolase